MVDISELKAHMARNDVNMSKLAKILGISRNTLKSRFDKRKFRTEECEVLIETFNIQNPADIFFSVQGAPCAPLCGIGRSKL